jgi:hypothetical protein
MFKHADNSDNDEENSDIDGSRIVVKNNYGFDTPSDTMSESEESVAMNMSIGSRKELDKQAQTVNKPPTPPRKPLPKKKWGFTDDDPSYNMNGDEQTYIEWEFNDPQAIFSANRKL